MNDIFGPLLEFDPGYYTFNEAMSKIYNQVEEKLLGTINMNITQSQQSTLFDLIEPNNQSNQNQIKLSLWKISGRSISAYRKFIKP